ncbi:MAG TPA: L-glutamate gamma-semialdehyde dehydrogenase [Deltaproteobacteria bacterium]|nr:L-glutamate gamma-semialdehyde dehydrogenase [Deltaproteobacteria bacterium]
MSAAISQIPVPANEPVHDYAPDSARRASLQSALDTAAAEVVEIPCVIAGEHVFTGDTVDVTMPCDHGHVLARLHAAGPAEIARAAEAAEGARAGWAALPWEERAAVYLRAADLLSGPHRDRVNAACMLGQGKTCHQAEIDAACELIDFWRFNAAYSAQILSEQPPINPPGVWNRLDHRPLDGFVFAITPFNFTAIGLNLPTAPTLMGNSVLWKPAQTASLSCFRAFQVLEAAGLPPGVINMLNGRGSQIGGQVLARPELAGLHFTGSTSTFQHLWRTIGERISEYRTYPRIVGETGGKDFILAHPSAEPQAVATAILRGAFEYQGQKCSAASRMYLPSNLWPAIRDRLVDQLAQMKMGDVRDFSNFLGAVIDASAFRDHEGYLALGAESAETVAGGTADRSVGWFVQPTVFRVDDPKHRLMQEEIFGPIATVFVYDEARWDEVLQLVDGTSPYALTGAVFAMDRAAIVSASEALRFAAGNFYINDKPTGAVVGQQPFGGGRASGTNDKAGSPLNLLRWTSPRAIKETFGPPTDWRYPFLG